MPGGTVTASSVASLPPTLYSPTARAKRLRLSVTVMA
jgi:hypothetical protein